MDQNCFTKIIAEEHMENFDAEYKGLDLNLLKVQSSNDFYNELQQVNKNFKFEYEVRNEEQQKSELFILLFTWICHLDLSKLKLIAGCDGCHA